MGTGCAESSGAPVRLREEDGEREESGMRRWLVSLFAVLVAGLLAGGAASADSVKVYDKAIMAGSATGTPPDSPANRVDPNTTSSPFAGVGSVMAGAYMGSGTPITPRHILTAGHLLDTDDDGSIDVTPAQVSFYLNYGGSPSQVIGASALAIHPDFTGFLNPALNDDLAIVTLASPLPAGVPIYPLYLDPVTAGDVLTMVGYGKSGYGDVGYTVGASLTVKRTGANAADLFYLDDEGAPVAEVFEYDFDRPAGSGSLGGPTLGNDVETTLGGGDSGGPSFIYDAGQWKLAGVNTYVWWFNGDTPGTFGTGGGGMLIYPALGWINSETGALIPEPATLLLAVGAAPLLALFRRRRR